MPRIGSDWAAYPAAARHPLGCPLLTGPGMGTARREVDDLLLVQAKYRMDALADQQRQMSERAESAVGHQHIAALQQGKNPAHASHVMRPQRRRENLQQQPGAGVEQR